MANNKNVPEQASKPVETTDSVETDSQKLIDDLRNGNLVNADIASKAMEELKKEGDEKKIRQLKSCIMKAKYLNLKSVIDLRRQRKYAKVGKMYADKTKALLDELTEGKITFTEYDKKIDELMDARRKEFREVDDQFRTEKSELDNAFHDWPTWSWDHSSYSVTF